MAETGKLSADVVVIGAGIAGGLAALKMARAGASVLMLESGPELHRGQIVENFRNSAYKGDFMDPYPAAPWAPQPKFQPADNGYLIQRGPDPYRAMYLRGTGGTTWHWAGQAFRLLPNDFRIQSYGIETIGKQLEATKYRVTIGPQARTSVPYDGRPACCGNNNCMPICPIDAQYHGGLSVAKARAHGVRVIPNAVVYRLEADDKGRIVAAHYLDQEKASHRVIGKIFVLTANGLESPKILLNSASDRFPSGVANSSDMVGRNLMDHPGSSVEFFAKDEIWFGRGPQRPASMNDFRDGDYRRDRAAMRIDIAATNPVCYLTEKLVTQGLYGQPLNETLQWQAGHYVLLKSLFEMLPAPENRVLLSKTEKDAWGIPRLEVHYKFPEYVNKAYDACRVDFEQIVEKLSGKNATYSPRGVYDNNQHITGTMIMGSDPKNSVVSGECRSHDHENLFIGGTGVMPSSATVNSTLTGVALAIKMAGHVLAALS